MCGFVCMSFFFFFRTFIPSYNFHRSGSPWCRLCLTRGCSSAAAGPGGSTSRKWQEASVSHHVGLFLGLPAKCPHDVEAGLFRASDPRKGETGAFHDLDSNAYTVLSTCQLEVLTESSPHWPGGHKYQAAGSRKAILEVGCHTFLQLLG